MGREGNDQVRMFGLKHQIFNFLTIFIMVILLLLGIFLVTKVSSFQQDQNQKRMDDLIIYAETLEGNIRQLNDTVGSIYSVSSAFQGISSYQTVAEKCSYLYELKGLIQMQVKSSNCLKGMFVHYDYGKGILYYTDNKLSYHDTKALWNTGEVLLQNSRGTYPQNPSASYLDLVQRTETDNFYSVLMVKNGAMISGSISLGQGIPEQLEDSAAYGVIYEGEFYRTAGEKDLSMEECTSLKTGRNRIGDKIVYLHWLNTGNIAVVEVIPRSIWLYFQVWHIVWILLMILLTVWNLFLYRFIYNQLAVPLEDMTLTLQNIRKGDWDVTFTAPNRIVEIEGVRQTIRMMLKEIGQYKIRTYEEQLERQKTQLQFLQLQLAPHFYTNCLKNIYYMLMMKEYESAEQFLLCLSKHLRYLLQRDTSLVSVKMEKEFVENYISLQKLLSSRLINCIISVDEKVETQEIPILALQTFVENSVKYTEIDKERVLVIRVQVKEIRTEAGDCLDLIIRDNGPGYPQIILEMLNGMKEGNEDKDFGVGILNLFSRLRIHYGDKAEWYFDNKEGAFSELILPARK